MSLKLKSSGGGEVDLVAPNTASNLVVTLPDATATLLGADSNQAITGKSSITSNGTGGIGYATGAGGTVTQATSRTTGVTLNKISGAITMFTAAGSATPQVFTVTNSLVAATDTIVINNATGASNYYFMFVQGVNAGSFSITFWTSGGTVSDTPVINFTVIKGANS